MPPDASNSPSNSPTPQDDEASYQSSSTAATNNCSYDADEPPTTIRPSSASPHHQRVTGTDQSRAKIKSILKKRPLLHSHSLGSTSTLSTSSSPSSSSESSTLVRSSSPRDQSLNRQIERKSILKKRDTKSTSVHSTGSQDDTLSMVGPFAGSSSIGSVERKPRPILKRNSLQLADQFGASLSLSDNDDRHIIIDSNNRTSSNSSQQRRSRSTSNSIGHSTAMVTFTSSSMTSPSLSGASSLSSSPASTPANINIHWYTPYHHAESDTSYDHLVFAHGPLGAQHRTDQHHNATTSAPSSSSSSGHWPPLRRTQKSGSFSSSSTYSSASTSSASSSYDAHRPHFQVDTLVVELAADEVERNERRRRDSSASSSSSSRRSISTTPTMLSSSCSSSSGLGSVKLNPILKNRRSTINVEPVGIAAHSPVRPILKKCSHD